MSNKPTQKSKILKYHKPVIKTKKLKISFFLNNSNQTDSIGFLFGNMVQAQSGGSNPVDDAFGENSSNSQNCIF